MDGMLQLSLVEDRIAEHERAVAASSRHAIWAGRRRRRTSRLQTWWTSLWSFWHPR